MTEIALVDSPSVLTAVAGQRIPRHAWGNVSEMSGLLNEAARVLQTARRQAEQLQRRAYFDGRAAGSAQAQAEAIKCVLDAQRQARELLKSSEARIVELAVAIVAHIAPRLDQGELVAALAAEGLAALNDERHVCIRISQTAEKSVRIMLDRWRSAHPQFESVQVLIDPELDPTACVIETELGRIEVGLAAQLDAVRTGLLAATESAP
jgi:type III secretion protein L